MGLAMPQCKCPFEFIPPVTPAEPQRTAAVGQDTRRAWVEPREWRGLTDEDWAYMRTNCGSIRSAVETAEAKLKEKNT